MSHVAQRIFRFMFYALHCSSERAKKKRMPHFATFLHTSSDFLVMRDNPPKSPPVTNAVFQPVEDTRWTTEKTVCLGRRRFKNAWQ
jgi:hypothetical protein